MAIVYEDAFTGAQSSTCSVAAAYAMKVQKESGHRLSEAEWAKHQHYGTWGVIKGKFQTGSLPDLPFAQYTVGGQTLKIGMKNGKLTYYNLSTKSTGEILVEQLDDIVDFAVQEPNIVSEFKWLGQHTPDVPNVPLSSKSVGSLSDEDAAALFVKVKDDIAKAKGINIKGINPQLDADVYAAIAKQTGYTAEELTAKVNAYKASGKKLSALKKKVKAGKAKTMVPNEPPSAPPVNLTITEPPKTPGVTAPPSPPSVPAAPKPIGSTTKVKAGETHPQYGYKVVDENGNHLGYVRKYESNVPVMGNTNFSVGHTKETKWYVYDASGKKLDIFPQKTSKLAQAKLLNHVKSNGLANVITKVPVEAAQDVAQAAVKDIVSSLPKYTDEEVAKAYIKAKDQLAADTNNKWTLYTQNNKEFEDAIVHLMSKSYDINLENDQIKNQIARYLGEGNKLSVLKKKMAKQGEYFPQADTLKGGSAKTAGSKTKALKDIDEMAGIYEPTGWKPFSFEPSQEDYIFNSLKNNMFAGQGDQNTYEKISGVLDTWASAYPGKPKPDLLSIVRVYDKKKAAQLGITNGAFYEKKLVSYASSPIGKTNIKAKMAAEELEKNLPPLPADSSGFGIISNADARRMQDSLEPWTPGQRDALQTYTGSAYTSMNTALRNGMRATQTIKEAQKGMRALSQDMLLHRGTSFAQFGLGSYENALQSIGKTVTDEGFFSTSVGGSPAFGGAVKIEVEVPKGTYGAFVDHISRHRGENELILAAGTKFKVLTVKKQGYQTLIRVRAIPGSHTKAFS